MLFRHLKEQDIHTVLRFLEPLIFKRREKIYKLGEDAGSIYLIVKGTVEISDDDGLETDDFYMSDGADTLKSHVLYKSDTITRTKKNIFGVKDSIGMIEYFKPEKVRI